MSSIFEITVQRRVDGVWPVVVEDHRAGSLLPVRSEGRLALAEEPVCGSAPEYGTALGQALFRDTIRDAFIRARTDTTDGMRVLVFVEDQELKKWRWERLCAPLDGDRWDFLTLDQRALFSLYLPSLTDRAFPPIGLRDLRALVLVANPIDPEGKYGLKDLGTSEAAQRVQASLGKEIPSEVLARVANAAGPPTLDELTRRLTEGAYTILHLVCHGRYNSETDETRLYLEQVETDSATGRGLPGPVSGSELIERLAKVRRLPYLIFLAACESSAPEAEQRLGGLAQRLVRELGIPAVIGMTEPITVSTANVLAGEFYRRLVSQRKKGEVDRALVEAYAGLAGRVDVNVPALYSRLGAQPLFSAAVDRALTNAEIQFGLEQLDGLLVERAPVLRERFAGSAQTVKQTLNTDAAELTGAAKQEREKVLTEINEMCQEVVEISFHALAQGEQPPLYDARQPFRGMSPFRAGDQEFFFGREALIKKLEQKLTEDHFLAVLGSSGSGKSSLVLAGLVPRLREKEPSLQVIDDLTPGSAPMEQLKARQAKLGPGAVLYIADQFEELFTLCKDSKQRKEFIEELLRLSLSDRVVLTMRADFWGECATYPALRERMQLRQELVAPMTTAELRNAMEQQAAKVGLRFEADLSNTMLDEVSGEPAAMPLLQHALLELWKRRHGRWLRAEEYRGLGGVKKAIAETADRLYNELLPSERDRMRDIFVRLTQIDESVVSGEERRDTRKRVGLLDLVPTGRDPEETKALVARLADAVLVVTSHNEVTQQDEVEVAHEALIRNWRQLRFWLDQDLSNSRLRESVGEAARDWISHERNESHLVHRGQRLESAESLLENLQYPLNAIETEYIRACQAKRTEEHDQKLAQIQREMEVQKSLAEARRKTTKWLRWALAAASAVLITLALGLFLFNREYRLTSELYSNALLDQEVSQTALGKWRDSEQTLSEILTRRGVTDAAAQMSAWSHWQYAPPPLKILIKLDEPIVSSAVDRDRNIVILGTGSGKLVTARLDTGQILASYPAHIGEVRAIVLDHAGRFFTAGEDHSVAVWFNTEPNPLCRYDTKGGDLWALAAEGNTVAAAGADGKAYLWDGKDCSPIGVLDTGKKSTIWALVFSTKGKKLFAADEDGDILEWPLLQQTTPRRIFHQPGGIASLTLLTSDVLVSGNIKGSVTYWNLNDGSSREVLTIGTAVTAIDTSNNGHTLLAGSSDGLAIIWDDLSARSLTLTAHLHSIVGMSSIFEDQAVLTASADGTVRLWPRNRPFFKAWQAGNGPIWQLDFSPNGSLLLSASDDGVVRLWDVETGKKLGEYSEHIGPVNSARFLPDGRHFVSGGADGTLRLWDVLSPHSLQTKQAHQSGVLVTAVSKENIITTSRIEKVVKLWSIHDLSEISNRKVEEKLWAIAANNDGREIAVAGDDGYLQVWEVSHGGISPIFNLSKNSRMACEEDPTATRTFISATFLPVSNTLVTGGTDSTLRLWPHLSLQKSICVGRESGPVTDIAASALTPLVASASQRGALTVWDIEQRKARLSYQSSQGAIHRVAISNNGHTIAAGTKAGEIDLIHIVVPQTEFISSSPLDLAELLELGQVNLSFRLIPRSAENDLTAQIHREWLAGNCKAALDLVRRKLTQNPADLIMQLWSTVLERNLAKRECQP